MDVFLTKYGHENCYFLVKNWKKKGILIDVLGRYYSVILTVLTFFWPNKVLKAGGLSWKFWKNDLGAQCFWENGRFFWKNLDLRAACFLENGRFLQNMGMRAMIFPWEIGKKGHHIDFFGSYYSVVLIELMFLIKYGHDSKGFLMKILKKLT